MKHERGQGNVEYVVILLLVAIVVMVIIGLMSGGLAVRTPDEALVECLERCRYYDDRPTLLQRCAAGCYVKYRSEVTQ